MILASSKLMFITVETDTYGGNHTFIFKLTNGRNYVHFYMILTIPEREKNQFFLIFPPKGVTGGDQSLGDMSPKKSIFYQ